MKNIMKRAWKLAREAASAYGGSPKSYIAEALKLAWAYTMKATKEIKAKARRALDWANEKINDTNKYIHDFELNALDTCRLIVSAIDGEEFKIARKVILANI